MIAATARAHGLTLVTHNSAEFVRVPGLPLEDWGKRLRASRSCWGDNITWISLLVLYMCDVNENVQQ
jgi:hypothetical protein